MRFPVAFRYGLVLLTAAAIAWTVTSQSESRPAVPSRGGADDHALDATACLGRILPEDGLVRLSARSLSGQPSIVAELLVKEGDAVRRGQLVAVLNSREQLEAAWHAAEARGDVTRTRLAQVKAGAKPEDLQAQRSEIAWLDVELANAQQDHRRYDELHRQQVVSTSELEGWRVRAESLAQRRSQAQERLNSLAHVRDVDVAYAEAELRAAVRAAQQARAELEQARIQSPVDGRVIRIHTWPGEEVGDAGIMELGRTARMYVVAEVDEGDAQHLKIGQRATVSSSALSETLGGVVEYIALTVTKNDEHSIDPLAPTDARVVETRILLDDAAKAARLINAQVTVLIAR